MGMKWTEGRRKGFITSHIRSAFRRWPPKYEVLAAAKVGKKPNPATGRIAEHYKCEGCKKHYPAKDVQVDHIEPVVDPVRGFINWDTFIERLLCGVENLQVLCKGCHLEKTKQERSQRKKK